MSSDALTYKIDTKFNASIIDQTVSFEGKTLWKRIADLEEDGIRQALIKLGWTPPDT